MLPIRQPLIIFDGICVLCNIFFRWIIKFDKKGIFWFTTLQSEEANEILSKFELNPKKTNTVILIDQGMLYTKSDAIFQIIKHLDGMLKLLFVLKLVPKSILNLFYDFIARYRYNIFGKKTQCLVPDKSLQYRFIS